VRIAIIGSGISGLGCAYLLGAKHQVTLFEAQDYLGGHTHTHAIESDGQTINVDSGFIVFNDDHYPYLTKLFKELGIASQETTMSFGVRNEVTGLEYNATNLNRLFCQRRNLLSFKFWGMVRDILRFYKDARRLVALPAQEMTLGDYLARNRYGELFIHDHLVPMASALWSSPSAQIMQFPLHYLLEFMANHQMLDPGTRKPWRVVKGGSKSYVEKLRERLQAQVLLKCPVKSVSRFGELVEVTSAAGVDHFDHVIFACHSDQALALLTDANENEKQILGAITFQVNDTVLHTDVNFMPKNKNAWAAWNVHIPAADSKQCTVTYSMNNLQSLNASVEYLVSLNCSERIAPEKILRRMNYHHPVYTPASVAAQKRRSEISGVNRTSFCGAYWGWGFHEDGMRSAVSVAAALGVQWP
jgi:uncharacterized protein